MAADQRAEQTKRMKQKFIIITIVIFIFLSVVFFAMQPYAPEYRFVSLEAGNFVMAFLSICSYLIVQNQQKQNTQAFIRGVSGASFLKLMVCMVSILVYVLLNRSHIHKPTVFVLFGIYAVYTIMETLMLSKMVRKKN